MMASSGSPLVFSSEVLYPIMLMPASDVSGWNFSSDQPCYCVDTMGLDAEMIRKYVKYQEAQERRAEQTRLF